ncbi:MAG TPA: hypothetical protein VER11_10360 [Polyangiaceae bacterium]|nr:hypothetical protein [Polyangiaceae bacterium]
MNLHRRGFACLLVLLLSACSSDSNAPANQNGPDGQQDISNVIYVGGVTDEALERMLDVAPKNDPRQAVIVDAPDLSVPVPKETAATFEFHLATEAKRAPSLHPGPAGNPPSKWRRGVHEFLQFLAPERIAHAHGTPYNGTAYYLVITDKDSKQILQVFTSGTSFTPEAADWQHLTDAPQPLTLAITSAFFEDNSVPSDGGPFVGGSFQFRIE